MLGIAKKLIRRNRLASSSSELSSSVMAMELDHVPAQGKRTFLRRIFKFKIILPALFLTICCAVGGFFYLKWTQKQALLQYQAYLQSQVEPSEILVSAVADGGNDVMRIPTLQAGVVKTVDVVVGQYVKKGDRLFSLDSAVAENGVRTQEITLSQAKNQVLASQIEWKHAKRQWRLLKSLDQRAVSRVDLRDKQREVKLKKIQYQQAQHQLALVETNLKNAQLILSQFTVLAPQDGIVEQVNAHPNEFIGATQIIVLLGDAKRVIVRLSYDERDIHYFSPGASAYIIREGTNEHIPMTFIQLDRTIVVSDRLNARVQEVLYSLDRAAYPNLASGHQLAAYVSTKKNA